MTLTYYELDPSPSHALKSGNRVVMMEKTLKKLIYRQVVVSVTILNFRGDG